MNTLLNGLIDTTNYTKTLNDALTHKTTKSDLLDMFAMGGAMRNRSEDDIRLMFQKAYKENPVYALKCLFYLRDARGGQGERRFFRVCMKYLTRFDIDAARRLLPHIAEYGRWDDYYCLVDTALENEMFEFLRKQLALDIQSKTPSLLAKWLKSENASSKESHILGNKTRIAFKMSHKQYRKTLSILRERINVIERLMSEGKWDEIEYDKIPSKAGLIYRNAFAKHDYDRYKAFAENKNTKVNAEVLNPVDIANKVLNTYNMNPTERQMLDKYWNNLKDYYNGKEENGIAICDVSGSMAGQPMAAAISMSTYIAERGKGPFKDYFITFSTNPSLVKIEGSDIYEKFHNMENASWGYSTNVEAAMNLLLDTACRTNTPPEEMPTVLYIFSDMEFNEGLTCGAPREDSYGRRGPTANPNTLFEKLAKIWKIYGYELPRVVFWNLNATHENIPALGGRFSYVSGFSMNMVEAIFSGKDGYDLMMIKLDSERYAVIH